MPILSSKRGHIDDERVRAILARVLESLGRNEKSIWVHYNEMAAVEDSSREVEWGDLADTILVFDGLFAAFLSAFLVFTIPQLQPNSTDISMDVLIHISQQLSNSTIPAYSPAEFTVPPSLVTVNVLFFLSLALVLVDAYIAMLVKSWLHEFDRGWKKYTIADICAQERERRLRGFERWRLAELVGLLPILIQTALLFFCIGLVVLLFPIHLISAIFSSVCLVAGFTFHLFTTYMSIFDHYAPFSSPVSRGIISLVKELQRTLLVLVGLIAHHVQHVIPGIDILFHTSHPSLPREHRANIDPSTHPLPEDNRVAHLSGPQGSMGVEKREGIAWSHSQIDPKTYSIILERLVKTTAETVENIPVFLALLDQPVKDPTLRPSNINIWKGLLHTTLGLLGDPSTFSDSAARTIARSVLFCYDGEPADEQLARNLIHHFDNMCSGQTSKHKTLNSLFAPYMHYYCGISPIDILKVCSIIASLEPSNAADVELLWMVNTIHNSFLWKHTWPRVNHLLGIFAAILAYVSSTEQSRRSQVPLTAAIIYAMHTIKSAVEHGGIHFINGHYAIPGIVLPTSESMSMTFHQVGALDLWSDDCVELTSALLQPHIHWSRFDADGVWKFQLALVAALYIDSTKHGRQVANTFTHLLRLTWIPEITMMTWGWADAYDQTKLAGYWYTAFYHEPIYRQGSENSPVQDIGYIIMQTIEHYSAIRLSSLHLLDFSVKYLFASSSSNWLTMDTHVKLCLEQADTDGSVINYAYGPFNPWILLHLDTLFSPSSTLPQGDIEQLEWTGTPEQVHIAMARLSLYDPLQGEEDKAKQLKPEPDLLNLFLRSTDYEVCTGAFRCCLNLASEPSSAGGIQRAGTFIPGTLGYPWIEHLIKVLCETPWHETSRSWEFLTQHLTPKWATLPPSWCCDFASAFLFLNVHTLHEGGLPAYQWFAHSISQEQTNHDFLHFLGIMLEHVKYRVTWRQLDSLGSWLAQLPEYLENEDAHVKLEIVLATRKQELEDETLGFFTELPMTE